MTQLDFFYVITPNKQQKTNIYNIAINIDAIYTNITFDIYSNNTNVRVW